MTDARIQADVSQTSGTSALIFPRNELAERRLSNQTHLAHFKLDTFAGGPKGSNLGHVHRAFVWEPPGVGESSEVQEHPKSSLLKGK